MTQSYRFPPGFHWGAATSAYQIEGSPLADGAGPSIWERFAHTPGMMANGDTGEHEYMRRTGDIRPQRLHRHFGPELIVEAKISNLKMLAADAKPFVEHAVALGRRGITMYIEPVPRQELFISDARKTP